MQKRLGVLLILIPAIASAAFVWKESASGGGSPPAPKQQLETPRSAPAESSDESHSQVPQHSPGEVIGVPMLA